MLSCKHIAEHSSDYLDGKMNFWQRMKFRSHLRVCELCSRFLKHLAISVEVSGKMARQPASGQEVEAVLQHLQSAPH